jgi:hypothetical protein
MDTSGTPNESSNESPWGNTKAEVNKQTAPPIAAFDAWGAATNEPEVVEDATNDNSNGWANFDSADFGQPARSSSPGLTGNETGNDKNPEQMETDTPSSSNQDNQPNSVDNGSGDMTGSQKQEKVEI